MSASGIVGKIISKLKKEEYTIPYEFSALQLLTIFTSKSFEIIRGILFIKPFLKRSKGLIFCSRGAKVRFGKMVTVGANLNLGRFSLIHGLCQDGVKIGDNFMLGHHAIIECTGVLRDVGEGLVIGDNVAINHYCFIGVRGKIFIGDNVIFGPRVNVFSENHNFNDIDVPIKHQGVTRMETVIEDDVWIGSGSSIMAGVKIGRGSVIASGSVVTKDVPSMTVMAGVPAVALKKRGS